MGSRRPRGLPEMPADRSRSRRKGRERDGEGDCPIRRRKGMGRRRSDEEGEERNPQPSTATGARAPGVAEQTDRTLAQQQGEESTGLTRPGDDATVGYSAHVCTRAQPIYVRKSTALTSLQQDKSNSPSLR